MSKNRELDLFNRSKVGDGIIVKLVHEMGIGLYWANKTSGKVHME